MSFILAGFDSGLRRAVMFWASAQKEFHRIEAMLKKTWNADLMAMCDSIKAVCPKWNDANKESILQNSALVQSFLAMKNEHYLAFALFVKADSPP